MGEKKTSGNTCTLEWIILCKSLRTTAETQGIVFKVSLDLYWISNSKYITTPSLIYKSYQDGRYRRRHSLCPSKG